MEIENFCEWQRRQGHKVIHTESSYWYEAGPYVFQAFPYNWLITPSKNELNDLIIKNRIAAIRYSTPIESEIGKISYHIGKKNPYSLEMIHNKSRKSILNGLSQCNIEEIPLAQLAQEGWALQKNTLIRQKRNDSMSKKEWENICLAAEGIPGFQAWGAFVNGELAASLLTSFIDDTGYFLYSLSQQKYLDLHVNHALFYMVTCQFLKMERIKSIFVTVESLNAPKSVDDFKIRIGLDPIAVRQRVVFHPILKPFVNKFSHRFIVYLLKLVSAKHVLSKAEGMIRFYLEGNLPAEQQDCPECLRAPNIVRSFNTQ
jgi:hypothetical protein